MSNYTRTVELLFKPDDAFSLRIPSSPKLTATELDAADYDLATVAGVDGFRKNVADFVNATNDYESSVDDFVVEVGDILDNADSPELFQTFTEEDVRAAIEHAGISVGDECVVMLRGHYDRLIGDGSSCVFDSNGTCIHRECGLKREALTTDDAQHVCTFDELVQATLDGGNVRVCLSPKCGREVPA